MQMGMECLSAIRAVVTDSSDVGRQEIDEEQKQAGRRAVMSLI
jgi:hypothetical protein